MTTMAALTIMAVMIVMAIIAGVVSISRQNIRFNSLNKDLKMCIELLKIYNDKK